MRPFTCALVVLMLLSWASTSEAGGFLRGRAGNQQFSRQRSFQRSRSSSFDFQRQRQRTISVPILLQLRIRQLDFPSIQQQSFDDFQEQRSFGGYGGGCPSGQSFGDQFDFSEFSQSQQSFRRQRSGFGSDY